MNMPDFDLTPTPILFELRRKCYLEYLKISSCKLCKFVRQSKLANLKKQIDAIDSYLYNHCSLIKKETL